MQKEHISKVAKRANGAKYPITVPSVIGDTTHTNHMTPFRWTDEIDDGYLHLVKFKGSRAQAKRRNKTHGDIVSMYRINGEHTQYKTYLKKWIHEFCGFKEGDELTIEWAITPQNTIQGKIKLPEGTTL